MPTIPDETLVAIGRLTTAVTDLEFTLAWIGADQQGGDSGKVFAEPGEPQRAARGSVEFAPAPYRDAFLQAVSDADGLVKQSHAAVRALWLSEGDDDTTELTLLQRPTRIRRAADPALFNDLAMRLMDCSAHLDALINAHLDGLPLPPKG